VYSLVPPGVGMTADLDHHARVWLACLSQLVQARCRTVLNDAPFEIEKKNVRRNREDPTRVSHLDGFVDGFSLLVAPSMRRFVFTTTSPFLLTDRR